MKEQQEEEEQARELDQETKTECKKIKNNLNKLAVLEVLHIRTLILYTFIYAELQIWSTMKLSPCKIRLNKFLCLISIEG